MTFMQFLAAGSNFVMKAQVKEYAEQETGETYETYDEVPAEEIAKVAPAPKVKINTYLSVVSLLVWIPMALALFSFKLWEWCFE